MIRDAMRTQAPLMFEDLLGSDQLELVVESRIDAAENSYLSGLSEMMCAQDDDHSTLVANSFRARDEAVREAIRQAIEFEPDDVSNKPHIDFYEVEGRAVIEGFETARGIWAGVWVNGRWRPAPQLLAKEGRRLSYVSLMEQFPDASLAAAYAFAARIPPAAFKGA